MESLTERQMTNGKRQRATFYFFLLPLAFCHLSCRSVFAESPQDIFKRANAAYAEGKFQEAAALYESARDNGLSHGILHYNLGNAFYKTGRLGKAIASYQRAFRLNSGDRDVLDNLQLVSTRAGSPVMPTGSLAALSWRVFFFFTLNTLTIVASVLFVFLCVAGVSALLRKPLLKLEASFLVLGGFCLVAGWLAARAYLTERPEGVIVTPVAEVRSGPNLSYPANFTVPEGHRVFILKEQEPVTDWVEIGVPDQGLKGWVPTSAMETL